MSKRYSSKTFNYNQNFKKIDFRVNPHKYQVGVGEQGVLLVEPYKSEILPFWRFGTPSLAKKSASKIYKLFKEYKKANDFVGMDMARKFLQMGFTRSRRYANHPSGKKYKRINFKRKMILPLSENRNTNEKAESARIFYTYYSKAKQDKTYLNLKPIHKELFG